MIFMDNNEADSFTPSSGVSSEHLHQMFEQTKAPAVESRQHGIGSAFMCPEERRVESIENKMARRMYVLQV